MTVLHDVSEFLIARSPDAFCDDCIAANLGLSIRQHANHKTRELANSPRFDRRKGKCSICGGTKLVIRNA